MTSRQVLALAGALLVGLALRLYALPQESAWGDEALTTWCYPAESMAECMECVFGEDDRLKIAPVFYLVQYGGYLLSGGSLVAMRLLSVMSGLGVILLVFYLGRRLFSIQAGLWAAWFQALSLYSIYFDQEVRFYAFMLLLSAASFALFIDLEQRSWKGWTAYLLLNTALLFTHSFAVFLFMAQGIALLVTHGRKVRLWFSWGLAHVGIALLLVGWIAWLDYDFDGQSEAYNDRPAGIRELGNGVLCYAGGRPTNEDPAPYMLTGISLDRMYGMIVLMLMGFATITAAARYFQARTSSEARRWWLNTLQTACWFLVPYLGIYLLAILWKPCFFPRYVLYSALPFPLLTGAALACLPQRTLFRHGVVFIVMGTLAYQNLALTRPFRADYQQVAHWVAQDPAETTTVIGLKTYNYLAVRYACARQGYTVQEFLWLEDLNAALPLLFAEGHTVWVVFDRWNRFTEFETAIQQSGASFQHHTTRGIPPLSVYRASPPNSDTPSA